MSDDSKTCPLLGGPCLQHQCHWYIRLQGQHPQTGQSVDEWGCAVAWLPVLQIEGAQQTRQAAAAIESFRNAVVEQQSQLLELIGEARKREVPFDAG